MRSLLRHRERHLVERIGWLRAAVLGANDGIVSTASLIVGVAAASAGQADILLAGTAGLVAGVLDAVDALDDLLQGLGHELGGVGALEAVGLDHDVHHGHADLRLFLAGNQHQNDEPKRQRRQQDQRRQRRADGGARQSPGKA